MLNMVAASRPFSALAMAEAPVPKVAAVSACTAMAFFYVAILYSPTLILRLPPPASLKSFMIRRFVCAAVSSIVSVFAAFLLLNRRNSYVSSSMFGVYGIRSDHLWQAAVFPLSLTSLLYVGSLVSKSLLLVRAWEEKKFHVKVCSLECIKHYLQRLLICIRSIISDVMAWRIYVVAPVTEEMVFRACMIPLLLCGGFKTSTIVFISPISFSLAHLNHFMELYCQQKCTFFKAAQIVGLQLAYTVVFGSYASFLFIRTGHFLAPVVAHIFCNVMGLPVLLPPQRKGHEMDHINFSCSKLLRQKKGLGFKCARATCLGCPTRVRLCQTLLEVGCTYEKKDATALELQNSFLFTHAQRHRNNTSIHLPHHGRAGPTDIHPIFCCY